MPAMTGLLSLTSSRTTVTVAVPVRTGAPWSGAMTSNTCLEWTGRFEMSALNPDR